MNERAETHACDLIERQAARLAKCPFDGLNDYQRGWNDACDAIANNAPSAQSEIIRCNECKHRPTPTMADDGITRGFSVEFPDEKCPCQCEDGWYNWYPENDFYCGYAERREE